MPRLLQSTTTNKTPYPLKYQNPIVLQPHFFRFKTTSNFYFYTIQTIKYISKASKYNKILSKSPTLFSLVV